MLTAVHTPTPIPIHWREAAKAVRSGHVNLLVIEKVERNIPSPWCHRAIWTRKSDDIPRESRVKHSQSLNKHCIKDIDEPHHSTIPADKSVTVKYQLVTHRCIESLTT